MTLIIEDGTAKTDSESYVTVVELDAYATRRGITLNASTESDKEVLLIKSVDYLENLQGQYQGSKVSATQALQWPRSNVVIDGFSVDSDEIPKDLKDAQLIGAIIVDGGGDLQPSISPKVLQETVVGAVSVTYSETSSTNTLYPKLTTAVSPLLSSGALGGFNVVRG